MRYAIAIQSIQVLYTDVRSIKFLLVMSSLNNLMQVVVESIIDDHGMCAHDMTQIDLTLKLANITVFG